MQKLLFWLLLFVISIFSMLPLKVHYFFAHILYFLLHRVVRYRLSTVIVNLSRSFPELKYQEINSLVKDYYRYLSDLIVEVLWSFTASPKQISKHIIFKNYQELNQYYLQGQGILVILAHQGNWEFGTAFNDLPQKFGIEIEGKDFYYIYKKMENPVANKIIEYYRTKHHSCTMLESESVLRYMVKNKGNRGIYHFLADQNPTKGAKFAVKFLGQETLMINGPEYIARKLKMPVFFVNAERIKRGYYQETYYKICDDASQTEEGFVTREYARLLEEGIRKSKSVWLWSHKRWKRSVEEEENVVKLYND